MISSTSPNWAKKKPVEALVLPGLFVLQETKSLLVEEWNGLQERVLNVGHHCLRSSPPIALALLLNLLSLGLRFLIRSFLLKNMRLFQPPSWSSNLLPYLSTSFPPKVFKYTRGSRCLLGITSPPRLYFPLHCLLLCLH
ncbi:unnamed protein product [Linum trigynum]|uniref:Uncharacterized protein n=1 Tax=Linum trigynum TaxID=586398 RepID=A0AAV2EUY9_9ROSI